MIKRLFYKFFIVLLAVAMLLTMTPITASATVGYNMSDLTDDLIITSGVDSYAIYGGSHKYRIIVNAPGETVNIDLEGVDIQLSSGCAFEIKAGTVNLNLTGPNALKSGSGYAGINNGVNYLTITGDAYSSLTAESGSGGAGIGGNEHCNGSNITIHSGTVTAIGWGGAGIGGGGGIIGEAASGGNGTNILIDGGNVAAQGREGAGIGGGCAGDGSNITIDGGTVVADVVTYKGEGAGIGGGQYGSGTDITIKKGNVIAKSDAGAGIGGGNGFNLVSDDITHNLVIKPIATKAENIIIQGGTVTAQGGSDSAGIGASYGGTASDIIIDGGSVKVTAGSKKVSGTNPFDIGSNSVAVTPKNSNGTEVFLATKDSLSDTQKGYLTGISYGMTNVNAIDGTYYLYLPKYNITYNNATDETHSNPKEYNILDSVTLSDAAKSDYTFNGWYDAATGGSKVTSIPEGSTGNKVLYAAWASIPIAESIQNPAAITNIAYGTEKTAAGLGLPSKVTLVTDQYSTDAAVTWDVNSCSYNLSAITEQTFMVSGVVKLPDGVSNKNSIPLTAQIELTVKSKPIVNPVLQEIITPAAITGVAHGTAKTATALGLPTSVKIKTDQGNVNSVVTWDVAHCAYDVNRTTEQTFTVNGTVTLPTGVANSKNLPLETRIGVTVKPVESNNNNTSKTTGNSNNNASQTTGGGSHQKNSDIKKKDDSKQSNDGKNTAVSSEKSTNGITVGNTEKYTDTQQHWAKDAISFVTEKKLFSGTGESQFSPNTSMTRGMLVTVFGRLWSNENNELNAQGTDSKFVDVDSNAFYSNYVSWAVNNGIVSGVGNGQFVPKESVTREQLAVMFYHYAKFIKIDVNGTQNDSAIERYNDSTQISGWAKEAMSWAISQGLLTGKEGDTLDPKGTATRAEVAIILQRFVEKNKVRL